jgi:hypothetical protein
MPRHLTACLPLLSMLAATTVCAADAHMAVHPEKGEMVLLRDVNARPAYRPAPPGLALIVDPTPNRELDATLGTGELSDADFAQLSAGHQSEAPGGHGALPAQVTGRALQGSLGRATRPDGMLSGTGIVRSVGGATGAVTGATRGIGSTVTGALSHLPLPAGGAGKGP